MSAHAYENVIIGSFKGRYRTFKSPRVDQLLSEDSMRYLRQLGGNVKEPVITATPLCKDRLIALSYIRPDKDEIGRPTVFNHTILLPCDGFLVTLKSVNNGVFIKEITDALVSPLPLVSVEIS